MAGRTGRLADMAAARRFSACTEIASEADRGLWFAAYVQTYLERDLRQLSAISSLPDFQRLMMLAAQRTGKLLNQADLARDAALSHPTAHRYLNLLETGCMITRLRPLATNPTAALVKAPKLLWTDCGLAAWLAGIRSSAEVTTRMDSGFWLEQTLFQTLETWRVPRSPAAQTAFLAQPFGARSGFHFGRSRQVCGAGNQGKQSGDGQ